MPVVVRAPAELKQLAAPLGRIVRATLALEERRAGEIGILIIGDVELRDLNHRWRGIDRATDVLSFGYAEAAKRVDGDLVISVERLRAQAKRYRVTLARELARLVVHGTLHLTGLDHHREAERRSMRAREQAALREVAGEIAAMEQASGNHGITITRRPRRRSPTVMRAK